MGRGDGMGVRRGWHWGSSWVSVHAVVVGHVPDSLRRRGRVLSTLFGELPPNDVKQPKCRSPTFSEGKDAIGASLWENQ